MTSRRFSHKVLLKWFTTDLYLEHLIDFSDSDLSAMDRRFAEALIHQTVMHQRMLEHVLEKFVNKKPKKPVYVALMMGTCELLYMSSADHAAINETVKLVAKLDQRSKGFVNAVLRKVLEFRNTDWEGYQHDPHVKPGIRYNLPDWLISRWSVQFGSETMDVLGSLNERPRKMARIVDTAHRDEILQTLHDMDVLEEISEYHPDYFFVRSWQSLLGHELFTDGKIIAQDVSALFPVMFIAKDNPESVADVCCAPGGKLSALAQYCPKTTKIDGYDLNPQRLEDTRRALERVGHKNISLGAADAAKDAFPQYSHVLIDAPCSGFGVIRKRTDLRWRRKEAEMPGLMKIQREILDNMAKAVKPGGLLVYSTCTFDSEENRGTIKEFLSKHTDFSIEAADPGIFPESLLGWKGSIESFPHRHYCEGSFAIALRKR